jgi:two-component system LytT family response regulator
LFQPGNIPDIKICATQEPYGMNEPTRLTLHDKVLFEDGSRCRLVALREIRYFETFGNYSKTYFPDGSLLIHRSLNYLDSRLPSEHFFRANRQYIVNISHINNVHLLKDSAYRIVMSCGKQIDISRRRSAAFRESLCL